jgi:GNAT superfamily N-acetyltransferase
MVEIRTFEGDAAELSEFTVRTWRRTYEGKMPVPLWSPEYLERELDLNGRARPYLVAAYDGAKLVASHPGRPIRIRLHGQDFNASLGSFLTVDPDYRRQGIAKMMHEEFERRHRERGDVVNFGYLYYRSVRSMGKKFWLKQPEGVQPVKTVGQWVRSFDMKVGLEWEMYRLDRWGGRAFSFLQPRPSAPKDMTEIRNYRPDDLDDCVALVQQVSQDAQLAYVWDAANLGRQLHYRDHARTVVLEKGGRAAGLVNYCRLDLLGRTKLSSAVIDLLAFGSLSRKDRLRLLQAAIIQMRDEGLQGASYLRGSWYGAHTLFAAGFWALRPEYYYIGTKMQDDVPLRKLRRLHVLWR